VVGFAIFHIVLFQKEKKKEKKRKEKKALLMVCECWWAPDGIGYPWFVKGKRWGGVPSFIKEHKSANLLIRLKCIYNFGCSMLVLTPFALCFVTLRGGFMHFPELTY
jgi:hypothetical protein